MSTEEDEIIDHDYEAVDTQQEEIMQRETARTNLQRLRNLRRLIVMITLSALAVAIAFLLIAYAIRMYWYEPVDKLITEDFPPKEVVLKVDGADELIAKMITPEDMQNIIAQQVIAALEPELERIRLTRSNLESVASQVRESNRENQESIQNFINESKKDQENTNKEIEKNAEEALARSGELLEQLKNIQSQSQSSDKEIANQVQKSIEKVLEKVTEVETVVQKELSTIETQRIIQEKLTSDLQGGPASAKTSYLINKSTTDKYKEEVFDRSYTHWIYPQSVAGTFDKRPNEQYCNFHFVRKNNEPDSYVTLGRINSSGNYRRDAFAISELKSNSLSKSLSEEDYKAMECNCIWYSDENTIDGPNHCK